MEGKRDVIKDGRKRYAALQLDTVLQIDDKEPESSNQPEFDEGGDTLDMKAETFFALMRRIRDMKKSWGEANIKRKFNATVSTDALASSTAQKDAPAPPLWTPMFRWEDFAPTRAAAGMAPGSQLVASSASTERGQEEIGTIVDTFALPQTHDEGVIAGDGDGQGRKGKSGRMNIQGVVDHGTTTLGTPISTDSQDFDRGVVDRGASVSSSSVGRIGDGNDGTISSASLELKLSFW